MNDETLTDIESTITPQITLLDLDQQQIDAILQTVPAGAKNVQEIYPLSPSQEGMLFHHLLNEQSDTYVLSTLFEFESRAQVGALIDGLQTVINRHDVLRTAIIWEQLPQPVQVVYRQAALPIEELVLDLDRDPIEQLEEIMRSGCQGLNLQRAPLMRLQIATDGGARCYALLRRHHIVFDHQSWNVAFAEAMACVRGRERELPTPQPYRNYVAWALAQARTQEAEAFLRSKLGAVEETTAPLDLLDVRGDGSQVIEAREVLELSLAHRVRTQARSLGMSAARLFHAMWALVVARTSGRDDVVYGTLLSGTQRKNVQAQCMLGLFVNTLPLKLTLRDVTAKELVEQTHRELEELLNYQPVSLTLAQRCSGNTGTAPLFTAVLNYRHSAEHSVVDPKAECATAAGLRVVAQHYRTNYPIMLVVDDMGEGFTLTAQSDRRMDPKRIIGYTRAAMQSLIEALERAPQTPASALSILPASERREILELFNATRMAYPQDKLIHELFEEQVQRTPGALAVVCEGQSLTYAELNGKANQLARYLRHKGVRPDQLVGICVERNLDTMVALLGILKAGGAYVPLDPNYPVERLAYMLKDAAPSVLLIHEELRSQLPDTTAEVIALDTHWTEIGQQSDSNMGAAGLGLRSHHLAYVIYTSGSTGQPKGVAIEHRNTVNLICWARSAMDPQVFQQTLHSTSFNFDLAVYECFVPLSAGGSIRLVGNALTLAKEPVAVTLINTVPSAIKGILDSGRIPEMTRVVNLAGEVLEKELVDRIFACSAVECVCNLYGPSETTTYSTWVSMPREGGFIGSIGRPIANTQIYILDAARHPVPLGVVGEIYIGGAGVARGYLNRPELTAERFLADPFNAEPLARMYKTGDLGRWCADGTIEYLGRNDHQVKIRGYRIELREIEAQLVRHHQVKEAVVVARDDTLGGKRLVAYIVPRGESHPTVKAVRAHLETVLPEYMIPSAFVIMQSFPLTPNGKLDRRALPAPEVGSYVCREYEVPQGKVEETLAEIWQELLEVKQVGRQDNFFELGGHSLLVLKALFRINRALGCALGVRDVYKSPTLRELSACIGGSAVDDDVVDLAHEAVLSKEIVAKSGSYRIPAQALLLTGATGFVGRFLLAQLLQDTDATIYCLVRAPSQHEASFRLRATLAKWDLWRDEFGLRIVAIPGDLRQPHLGLDELTYQLLSSTLDGIYHCASSMNHLETYAMAKRTNVDSTTELLKMATDQKPKLINYISTLSVFSSRGNGAARILDEASRIDHERHSVSRGYVASKWVGEKIFMLASERGIPCNIFRLGLVWADSQQGRYDELQREYRIFKSCLLSDYGIRNYRYEMTPIPVDYVARSVVFLAKRHPNGRGIFHISSSNQMIEGVFERCNEIAGTSLELVPLYDWIQQIRRLHHAGWSLPVVPLVDFAFSMDEASFYEHEHRLRSASIHFDCTRTQYELECAGIEPAGLTDDLLRVYVESMRSRDAELRDTMDCGSDLSSIGGKKYLRGDGLSASGA